jgi:hypothetical protein
VEPVIALSLAAAFTFITKTMQSNWKTTCWKLYSRARVIAQRRARTPAISGVVLNRPPARQQTYSHMCYPWGPLCLMLMICLPVWLCFHSRNLATAPTLHWTIWIAISNNILMDNIELIWWWPSSLLLSQLPKMYYPPEWTNKWSPFKLLRPEPGAFGLLFDIRALWDCTTHNR